MRPAALLDACVLLPVTFARAEGPKLADTAAGPPAAAAATVVGNQIVVEFDAPATQVLDDTGVGPIGLTMSHTLDLLGVRFGVSELRKEFRGADAASGRSGFVDSPSSLNISTNMPSARRRAHGAGLPRWFARSRGRQTVIILPSRAVTFICGMHGEAS